MEIKIYSVLAPQWMNIKSLLKKFVVEFIHEKIFRDRGLDKKRQRSGDIVSTNCTLNNAVVTLKKFRF
jgi:hypothetical protein